MKFPEQRLSMETALPPSVQNWFGHELEMRGIDSLIYSRHVIQLLQQEVQDDAEFPDYVDLLFDSRIEGKGKLKLKRLEKRKPGGKSDEERKKSAAIKCLKAVSDEVSLCVIKYCKRGYFRWGKISRKCSQDLSRGGNFHDISPIFSIKSSGFYFPEGEIFAKKVISQKTRKLPPCENFHVYSSSYPLCRS